MSHYFGVCFLVTDVNFRIFVAGNECIISLLSLTFCFSLIAHFFS